jgi:MFS family permease
MSTSLTDHESAGTGAAARPRLYKAGTLRYTAFGLFTMMVWMLWGDFVWRLMDAILPSLMPFLLKEHHASNMTIQLLSKTIAFVLTFSMSPIVSFRSDRHRGKYGRRIPYMLWTTPFVGACLILIGFYKDISRWLVGSDGTFFGMPIETMYIVTFGVLLVAYDVFSIFVNDVYYYLFNDVVPEQFFTRFQSIFAMVGVLAGAIFSAWIFPYALVTDWQWVQGMDNFKLVMASAGILYGVGFMVMCYMVKEGQYPPPPPLDEKHKGQEGPCAGFLSGTALAGVGRWMDSVGLQAKTYAKECFTHRYYWYFFLSNTCLWMTYAIGTYVGLRNRYTLGVNFKELGWLGALTSVVSFIILYPAGWIADKLHPLRVYLVLLAVSILNSVVQSVWIIWDFGHDWNLYVLVLISLIFLPVSTVRDLASGPMYMRLLPKERYGQFCSANGMLRAFITIFGTLFTGWLMDVLETGNETLGIHGMGAWAYRLWPIWVVFWQALAVMFLYLLYRLWKQRGGEKGFTPPAV